MRIFIFLIFSLAQTICLADTIEQFMNISHGIPTMEMKADPNAQAWARSARNVLNITAESIAETLLEANQLSKSQGKPLFCIPDPSTLNAKTMTTLIENAYLSTPDIQNQKDKLSVSKVAWMAVIKAYPCKNSSQNTIKNAFTTSEATQVFAQSGTTMEHVE